MSAVAALALGMTPAGADEQAPDAEKSAPPGVQNSSEAAMPVSEAPTAKDGEAKPAAPGVQVAQTTAAQPASAQPGSAQPMAPAPEKLPPPDPPRFTYGGQADFYFSSNINNPFTGTNLFRAYDVEDEKGVHLGLIDLWAQYARRPIGGRLDLNFGPTSRFTNFAEPSRSNVWQHIQQAYVSANLDGKKGRTFVDFGKWVTPAGAELIEPKENWLYSRGLLFSVALPYYHFGGRIYHYFNDTDYVMGAGIRGWNAVGDPGHGPGFILSGSKMLSSKWTATGNYIGGEEFGLNGADYRHLFDFVLLYNPGGRWNYTFNPIAATQSGSSFYGISSQAKYNLSAKQYLAFRGEVLRDDSGLISGNTQTLGSATVGFTHLFNKYAQTRLEYRHDFGKDSTFPEDRPGRFRGTQGTFLISAILSY